MNVFVVSLKYHLNIAGFLIGKTPFMKIYITGGLKMKKLPIGYLYPQ
jgi:hypothetical protein